MATMHGRMREYPFVPCAVHPYSRLLISRPVLQDEDDNKAMTILRVAIGRTVCTTLPVYSRGKPRAL
jgi:hypothetical protein